MLRMLAVRRTGSVPPVHMAERRGEDVEGIARPRLPFLSERLEPFLVWMGRAVVLLRMEKRHPDQAEQGNGCEKSRAVVAESIAALGLSAAGHCSTQLSGLRRRAQPPWANDRFAPSLIG
jgi:hypothetical protein